MDSEEVIKITAPQVKFFAAAVKQWKKDARNFVSDQVELQQRKRQREQQQKASEQLERTLSNAVEASCLPVTSTEPPSALCCPLSGKLLQDPVSTKEGYVYDRMALIIQLNGQSGYTPFDTQQVSLQSCIEQPQISNAVQTYLNRLDEWLEKQVKIYFSIPEEIPFNPPGLLRCRLSKRFLQDPVVTPGGNLYEKQALQQWLDNHKVEPSSRTPLSLLDCRPWPLLGRLAKKYCSLWEKKHLEVFKINYCSVFDSTPIWQRNPFSTMHWRLKKNPDITMQEITKYGEDYPTTRTARILKKL